MYHENYRWAKIDITATQISLLPTTYLSVVFFTCIQNVFFTKMMLHMLLCNLGWVGGFFGFFQSLCLPFGVSKFLSFIYNAQIHIQKFLCKPESSYRSCITSDYVLWISVILTQNLNFFNLHFISVSDTNLLRWSGLPSCRMSCLLDLAHCNSFTSCFL